jgi:hypothetical protein
MAYVQQNPRPRVQREDIGRVNIGYNEVSNGNSITQAQARLKEKQGEKDGPYDR